MKNTLKLLGTYSRWLCAVALVAVIGFGIAACDNGNSSDDSGPTNGGSETTKFEGKWVNHDAIDNYGMTDVSYTFSGNTFVFRSVGQGDNSTYRGTFTFNDVAFTFMPAEGESWTAYSQNYTLQDNVLALHVMNYQLVSGPFTKEN